MIKTIIKRDGSKEHFLAEKINGWGEWAAENLGKYVNWSDVVLDTVARLPENTSAVDLQETLIQTCLDKKSNNSIPLQYVLNILFLISVAEIPPSNSGSKSTFQVGNIFR